MQHAIMTSTLIIGTGTMMIGAERHGKQSRLVGRSGNDTLSMHLHTKRNDVGFDI